VLAAVAATGASGAIAIGNDSNVISGSQLTLAEEWSGAHWTTLVTSNP
jgi:hypothetical protein